MSVFDGARQAGAKAVGGGDYLDKDELVRGAVVFGLGQIQYQETGGFQGKARWAVPVEPWYEDDDEPSGLLTFDSTAFRDEYFSKLADAQDELARQGDSILLGPCVLVKAKSKNYRYFDILEWDEEQGAPNVPSQMNVIGWGEKQEPELPPQPAAARTRPARPSRPGVDGGRATPASSAVATSGATASSSTSEAQRTSPPAPTGRRRPGSQGSATGQSATAPSRSAPTPTEPSSTPRRGRPPGSKNRPKAAEVPATAPRAAQGTEPPPGGGQAATEVLFQPGQVGSAHCPQCDKEAKGKVYGDPNGQPMIIHQCPIARDNVVLLATSLEE